MSTYLCSYTFRGAQWEVQIQAKSMDEAQARVRAMRTTVSLDGELLATMRVPNWWTRLTQLLARKELGG